MTLSLKDWIAKVTTIVELLKDLKSIEQITCPASGSVDVSLGNSDKAFLIGSGGGNSKIVAVANCSSTGSVSNLKVSGATNMTLTNGTNKLTVNNGYAYGMTILVIIF